MPPLIGVGACDSFVAVLRNHAEIGARPRTDWHQLHSQPAVRGGSRPGPACGSSGSKAGQANDRTRQNVRNNEREGHERRYPVTPAPPPSGYAQVQRWQGRSRGRCYCCRLLPRVGSWNPAVTREGDGSGLAAARLGVSRKSTYRLGRRLSWRSSRPYSCLGVRCRQHGGFLVATFVG